MKKMPEARNIIIPVVTLVVGLILGLGVGQMQLKTEQKVFQDKIKEANRKISFMQKKMSEDKNEAMVSLEQNEQKCRGDLDKLQLTLRNEKKTAGALGSQVAALTGQAQKLEARIKAADDTTAKTRQELQEAQRTGKDLDRELKKTAGEKQALQTDLKKTTRELGACSSNNWIVKLPSVVVKCAYNIGMLSPPGCVARLAGLNGPL